ncbi:MAG: 30S ribosomal protein S18 [Anaerolineae bacterium]|nr:30S ribosomal protein S18 [Anaerolineae bacterium]
MDKSGPEAVEEVFTLSENYQNDERRERGDSPRQSRPRRNFGPRKKATGCSQRCVGRQGVPISYKEIRFLENYLTRSGKIRPRRQTGNCAKHQRQVALAIKRARYMAFLPLAPGHEFTTNR